MSASRVLVWTSLTESAGKKLEVTYVPKAALERTAALPRTPENFWNIFGAEVRRTMPRSRSVTRGLADLLQGSFPKWRKPTLDTDTGLLTAPTDGAHASKSGTSGFDTPRVIKRASRMACACSLSFL